MSKRNRYNDGYIGTNSLNKQDGVVFSANKPYITNIDNIVSVPEDFQWVRPAEWLPMPSMSANDQMFSGLLAVYRGASGDAGASADSNFVAFVLGLCGSNTNYLVDWGDGSAIQQYASGVTAQRRYNFANIPENTQTPEGFRQVVIKAYPAVAGNTMALIDLQTKYQERGVTFTTDTTAARGLGVHWMDIKIAGAGVSLCRLAGGGAYSTTQSPSTRNVLLTSLERFEWVGPSSITNFANFFSQLPSLIQVAGTEWTSRATTMQEMFFQCRSLLTIPHFDTQNVTMMSSMFSNCISLQSIPPLNTSNVSDMSSMVASCYSLKTFPFINTSKVTTFNSTWSNCRSLKTIPSLDWSSCTNAGSAFYYCQALSHIPRINLTSRNLTNVSQMFSTCTSLQKISVFDITDNPITGINASTMFGECASLESLPRSFTTKGFNSLANMFSGCTSLKSATVDFSRVSNFVTSLFSQCLALRSVELTNTSNLTSTQNMFMNCYSLKTIPTMDTSNVTNATNMFYNCYALVSVPPLDLSKCTNPANMFYGCYALQVIPGITLNTTATFSTANMFYGCQSLKQIPTINTSRSTNMSYMFGLCHSLTSVPLFDLSNCTTISNMFSYCYSLKTIPGFTNGIGCSNATGLFLECLSLETVPHMTLHPNVLFDGMFQKCRSLRSIGGFTASTVGGTSTTFSECYNLSVGTLYGTRASISYLNCNLSPTELNRIFTNLSDTGSGIVAIGGNWGSFTCDRSIATAKGFTVTG